MEGVGLIKLIGLIGPMGLIGLMGSQKRQLPKGEALKRSTDIPDVHHVRRPCPIRDRTGASYYLLDCEGIDPRGGEPSLTRGEGYSVGTATRALPAETALMLLPLIQGELRKKCASPSLG